MTNEAHLREIWETRSGWRGWFSTVDHKTIGLRYIVTAFVFLMAGGVEALVMRLQLAKPNEALLNPEQYNQLFSLHGITMVFLYAGPVLTGFSNYLWPLLLGARDMAFPRLNAFSYWLYLSAGVFLYAGFPFGLAPNDGWFDYVPYANRMYNPGPNIDIYALGMVLLGISTTVGAANFVVTVALLRAPGMSLKKLPIMIWGTLSASVANLLAIPSVSLAFFLLWCDRRLGTHFFDMQSQGQALLWQHLFWIFAHPWVYVIVLPAMGLVSDALPVFCRTPLVGYMAVALSTVATMLIGFDVWVHHMFATGISPLTLTFFSIASMLISIPSAVAVFAWIATIWAGKPVYKTPFLFFLGFILMFVVGGVSGVMTAAAPLDLQLNETYFVVGHLHYVLLGINVFPVLGGIAFWFPKFTGRMMNERLGRWSFWITIIGFNLGFFPMHIAGLRGMPRRIYTYPPHIGWDGPNMATSIGSFLFALGVLVFLVNIFVSLRRGVLAGNNPWDAPTLAWSISSPPPPYNFMEIPAVSSRYPLWQERLGEGRPPVPLPSMEQGRQTPAVTPVEGKFMTVLSMPRDSYMPFFGAMAAALLFVCLFYRFWEGVISAAGGTAFLLVSWLWPRHGAEQKSPTANWGIGTLIITEGSLFGYLLFAYFYLWSQTIEHWPPEGSPKLFLASVNTLLLLSSSLWVWMAERALRRNARYTALAWLAATVVSGAVFVGIQLTEWKEKGYGPTDHLYGSFFFTVTGFHMMHVVAGLFILSVLGLWGGLKRLTPSRLRIGALYWHFVDAVWIFVFSAFYLLPHIHQ